MATRERPAGPAAPTELIGPPGPPPPAEPPPDRELWPWLLVLLALVIAGLAAAWYATRDTSSPPGPVTVQTTVAAARPKPKPVKHTTTAATVTQPQTVVVPDLVGQSRDAAVNTLEAQGLTPDVQEVPSASADGTVVSQHPAAGTNVDAQSGVLINVGRKVESAPATTAAAAATPPATRTKAPTATSTPAKTVSNTTPRTPTAASVPSVVGEDEGTAQADLVDAGFSASTVDQTTTDATQNGMVISQSPTGGSSAGPGSTVTIYVARYSGSDELDTG